MAKKIGVIAGVGEKSTNTNVIMPEFDAAFRLATLSTSVLVIDGLTLSNGILKAGHVVFEGYMCELKNDVSWGDSQQVFLYLGKDDNGLVNSCWFSSEEETETITIGKTVQRKRIDSNTIGVFNDIIDVSECMPISQAAVSLIVIPSSYEDTETATFNRVARTIAVTINRNYVSTDNIPDTDTAEYVLSWATKKQNYVQLISNGLPTYTEYYAYPYPRKCKVADMATAVVANGTIDSTVTATTQPVNNHSAKVATTEFVQKQIAEDIGASETTITILTNKKTGDPLVTMTLKRKAHFVLVSVDLSKFDNINLTTADNPPRYSGTIPSGFRPLKTERIAIPCYEGLGISSTNIVNYVHTIDTNGVLTPTTGGLGLSTLDTVKSWDFIFGYQCE